MSPQNFALIELNEAFASQVLAVPGEPSIDPAAGFFNPNCGVIVPGHPLGMSGARIIGSAALELSLGGQANALCTMCVGVGQGVPVAMLNV